MIILGLHFGHDAGAAVLRNGKIVSCVTRERQTRVKHAMTLDVKTIRKALEDAEIKNDQIDFCAITSTQGVELLVDNPNEVSISLKRGDRGNGIPCNMNLDKQPSFSRTVLPLLFTKKHQSKSANYTKELYEKFFPEYKNFEGKENEFSGWIDEYVSDELWQPPKTLRALLTDQLSSCIKNDFLRYGFHFPASVILHGVVIPAFFISHHACHAASSYYQSGLSKAAILVQDGGNGVGCDSGMFYYAEQNRIYPIAPHHSILGFLYDQVASSMNLGESSAGKLMGLAAYGTPSFYDSKFLGNRYDLLNTTCEEDISKVTEHWLYYCLSRAKDLGYDLQPFGDTTKMTAKINVDIAASTQKLFEENTLVLVKILHNYLQQNEIDVDGLCLSGGTALNCPANSRIYVDGQFKKVFVEPGCDDSGLAIGAALGCYHNLLNYQLPEKSENDFKLPYLGPRVAETDILSAIECFGEQVYSEKISNCALDAARALAKNQVVGWFYGRSEIGPRALGHRSILADARDAKNWERVNKIKARELWRPFAPAVLESETEKWFSGTPIPAPYMLFNATVKSKDIPAITHVDGSARIQTVNENNGAFYDLLNEFFELTGVPILLNTSFNGPGEPIVETPMDAVKFFANSELDVLYVDSYKLTRKPSSKSREGNRIKGKETTLFNVEKFMADFEYAQKLHLSPPKLIEENYKNFNIIDFGDQFFGFLRILGEIDFAINLDEIRKRYDHGCMIVCGTLEKVKAQIDKITTISLQHTGLITPVVVEIYKGFNLVVFKDRLLGIRQSLGKIDLSEELIVLVQRHTPDDFIVARSLDQLRDDIDGISTSARLRHNSTASHEQVMARIDAFEAQSKLLQSQILEQQQLIDSLQANWSVCIPRGIKRIPRGSK